MPTNTLRLSLVLALAAALTLAGLSRPRAADAQAATTTINMTNQINATLFVPCANDGAGEFIQVTGDIHSLIHFTFNDNHTTIESHSQPQGVVGVGLTTGDTYHGTGVSQNDITFQSDGATSEVTVVVNFRFIGPGPGNNLLVHNVLHNTVNNNGELTSSQASFSADCK